MRTRRRHEACNDRIHPFQTDGTRREFVYVFWRDAEEVGKGVWGCGEAQVV
jgi:hypothetical protein